MRSRRALEHPVRKFDAKMETTKSGPAKNTYDLFISYSRRDNAQGRVTELVGKISHDFEAFAGRPLRPFFDLEEIRGMDDWRHRINN